MTPLPERMSEDALKPASEAFRVKLAELLSLVGPEILDGVANALLDEAIALEAAADAEVEVGDLMFRRERAGSGKALVALEMELNTARVVLKHRRFEARLATSLVEVMRAKITLIQAQAQRQQLRVIDGGGRK